jgi:hypothetical protein
LQSIDESLYLIGCPFVTPPKALWFGGKEPIIPPYGMSPFFLFLVYVSSL